MKSVYLRDSRWLVRSNTTLGTRVALRLEDLVTGETIEALCPPDEFEPLTEREPTLNRRALTPFSHWCPLHEALWLQTPLDSQYAAFAAARNSPEPYQFAPLLEILIGDWWEQNSTTRPELVVLFAKEGQPRRMNPRRRKGGVPDGDEEDGEQKDIRRAQRA